MVPALKTPRQQHALGGVLSMMRGEILRQGPGCGPSLYDPLTGDSRSGDVGPGAIRAMIETCADRKTGVAMLPLTFAGAGLPQRMDCARPGFPCLRHLSRSLPFIGPARTRLRWRFPPVSRFRRCRRSQVSGKRSKPLTSYRRKHKMANQKPVDEIRIGRVKATIWRNGTDEQLRHNVTFSRLYKDGDQWKSTQSFGRNDLLVLAKVADLAHSRLFSLPQEEETETEDES